MATYEEWLALAERCAEATGPSRRLDAEIYLASDGDEDLRASVPPGVVRNVYTASSVETREFTASIDAIVALIEHDLPGWLWKVGTCHVSDDACICPDFNNPINGAELLAKFGPGGSGGLLPDGQAWNKTEWNNGFDIDRRPPGNVALALCESYCWAKAEIARVEEAALAEKEPTP